MKASPQDFLDEAIRYENIARDCGPHDPAFRHFCNERDHFFKLALDAEKDNS